MIPEQRPRCGRARLGQECEAGSPKVSNVPGQKRPVVLSLEGYTEREDNDGARYEDPEQREERIETEAEYAVDDNGIHGQCRYWSHLSDAPS